MITFSPIPAHRWLHGWTATVGLLDVEVYRCAAGRWDVQGERRRRGSLTGYCEMLAENVPYCEAMGIARSALVAETSSP